MANRYWLGGIWNSTANWSATNNGAGGASIPTSADSVFWHTIPTSSTYTVDVSADCLDMDWTGATNSPTLAGSSVLNVYGSFNLTGLTTRTYSGNITFRATTTGKTLTFSGSFSTASLIFDGVGGYWTLQDSLNLGINNLTLNRGTLDTNGKSVTLGNIFSNSPNTRVLTLGSSTITVSSTLTFTSTLTLNAGTSTIIMTGATRTFTGGGLTYYNVTLAQTIATIADSNTFNTLTFTAGKTVNVTAGTTQTALNFVFVGTVSNLITIQSTSAGSAYTFVKTGGSPLFRYCSIKDCTTAGGRSIAGTNVSGNTGIAFGTSQVLIGQIKDGSLYWINSSATTAKVSG